MRYVIRTAISHGHIKWQITTVGSHGYVINTCILYLFGIPTKRMKVKPSSQDTGMTGNFCPYQRVSLLEVHLTKIMTVLTKSSVLI